MPAPTITGTVSSQATTSETPIDPFSGVTIGDANAGATDTLSITFSGPGSLSGTGLSGSNGSYALTGTAAAITSELRALSFTPADGVPNTSVTTTFTLSDTSSAYGVDTYDSQISTLATFTGANGAKPLSDLVSDAAGDLFGTTSAGGADNDGTVFEIAKSTGELTTLASFTGANGDGPWGGVTSDAAGDLFGTTAGGGADNDGTVFEIAKSTGLLSTLATFTGANGREPFGTVISDAAGDLFGTANYGGADNDGTVFEIAKSTGQLTTLVTFTGANGANPAGSLTIDAEGDLFGTTANGGADDDGTVFEIAKSTGELTTLATFTDSNGAGPERNLTIDAAGDLFGTTFYGGADNDGTVFEIVKSTGALITLATFTGANGLDPLSDLVSDAAGDLFGTTEAGGADNDGTAFEIAKSTGLLSTLATFTGANGEDLDGGLTINSAGDLFGTTYFGGVNSDGTLFELPATFVATPTVNNTTTVTVTDSDSVFAPTIIGTVPSQTTTSETPIDPFSGVTIGDTNAGATDTLSITLSGPGSLSGTGLSGSNGSYTLTGTAAAITSKLRALSFTPVDGVPHTSVTTTFTLSDTSSAGLATVNNTTVVTDSDPAVAPTITGTVPSQTTTSETPIDPFSGVTIGDTNAGATDTLSITLSGPGSLSGTGLSGSNGSYTLTGTAAAITSKLRALSFTPVDGVPHTSVTTTFTLSDTSSAELATVNKTTVVTDSDPVLTTLANFSWAQGWGSANNPREVVETATNPSGDADYVGFGTSSVIMAFGESTVNGPTFTNAIAAVHDFGSAEGYTAAVQRGAADTGDSIAPTVYGQGFKGVYWYDATGGTGTDPTYQSTPNLYPNFGSQQGWTPANGFDVVKADSSDAYASILGFGNAGIVVGPQAFDPSTSGSPPASYLIPFAAGNNSGWSQTTDIRSFVDSNGQAIDLNGDGVTDFVGMGPQGLEFAFGSDTGGQYSLGALQLAQINGTNSDFGDAQGWNDSNTTRDIVKDPTTGYYDIIAFGAAGVYVSMGQDPSTHGGQPFGQSYLALDNFGLNQGWSNTLTPRLVGDVNGDGIPDIVGFGASNTFTAFGSHNGSGDLIFTMEPTATIANYGYNEGWSTSNTVRTLADVDGSGRDSLVLSGANGTQTLKFG